ncbi:MAG TPA: DEAD/DEAH box helicase, partial [Gemmatimonadaceae bacterium]|nr:DEAD/DEAH box helicase [Gemmatimonadaceae bacterium]
MGGAVTLADVRAFIAERLLGQDERRANGQLGSITLRPHQQSAVERLRSAVDEFGGALLCDQVGMGKTFAALALCGEDGACVVAPAVLKDMWQSAADSAGRTIEYTSTESLSRVRPDSMLPPTESVDQRLLIVDEAHHFRNPATKRFASLARVASKRRVLLLSATPIHNRKKDLTALVSLFLGSYAETLTQSEIGRLIVRREQSVLQDNGGFPNIEPPEWLELNHDDNIPRLLLGLPPPLPPRDGGDGGVLVIHSLLRQWSSSDAALERALTRRLQRGIALVAGLESGTYPSQAELSAWNSAEDCVQLAFAELVASGSDSTQDLLPVVRTHADALSQLLRRIRAGTGADAERVDVICAIRRKHGGMSVVAFSQYADTIDALFRHLASDGYVAALTGNGARVAGGRITRVEAIRRFAPFASGVSAPSTSESVTLLLTTDLLSEGVNLQDAGVVIHVDLPWTPARMEQRLGRVARMGSRHERVYSYVIRPPASTEELIHLEYMLREKMKAAGIVVDDFPSLSHSLTRDSEEPVSTPCLTETIRSILEAWSLRRARGETREPMVAAVAAP